MNESGAELEDDSGRNYPSIVVLASGLFGIAAAGIMFIDANSRGEEYLQDSMALIVGAAALGAISFVFGIYLYIKR